MSTLPSPSKQRQPGTRLGTSSMVKGCEEPLSRRPFSDWQVREDPQPGGLLPCPFLQLPQEIRLLIFQISCSDRQLMVSDGIGGISVFNYGNSACRKLLQINRQIRSEAKQVRQTPLSLQFAGRAAFCQFLASKWSVCSVTGQSYVGSSPGLLVSEKTLGAVHVLSLAPGTTEVGYLDLASLSKWLPSLERLELDLTRESMWVYSRIPNITQEEILIKEINWRLGTIFGVDASSLRQDRKWALVVYASFMLPADPEGDSSAEPFNRVTRLNVVSLE